MYPPPAEEIAQRINTTPQFACLPKEKVAGIDAWVTWAQLTEDELARPAEKEETIAH